MQACRRAFSIVELFVIIGILLIALSLTMPAFSSSIANARQTVCLSEMKQIGNIMFIYSQDNRDYWPSPLSFNYDSSQWTFEYQDSTFGLPNMPYNEEYSMFQRTWHLPLQGSYLEPGVGNELLVCSEDDALEEQTISGNVPVYLSRYMSFSLGVDPSALTSDRPGPEFNELQMTKTDQIVFPSAKCVLFESQGFHDEFYKNYYVTHVPSGKYTSHSVLAGDGSVAHRSKEESTLPVIYYTYVQYDASLDGYVYTERDKKMICGFDFTRNGVFGRDW